MSMLYFNAWAIGTLVCCIFTILLFTYLAFLKNKTAATTALAILYLGAFVLDLGFFLSAVLPAPIASFHRFLTIPGAFTPLVSMVQLGYSYPRNIHRKESRIVLGILIAASVLLTVDFAFRALQIAPQFDFKGQIFNYPHEYGARVAAAIMGIVLWFVVVTIRKALQFKGEERRALIQMSVALLIPTFIPGLANALFQNGRVSYLWFQWIFVASTLLGYFAITIVFINNAVERTSFMTKIVGISLVTILLVVQLLATVVGIQSDENYDQMHIQEARNYRFATPDENSRAAYILEMPMRATLSSAPRTLFRREGFDLDLQAARRSMFQSLSERSFERRLPRWLDLHGTQLYYAFHIEDSAHGRILEVGFPYLDYRSFQDKSARLISFITLALAVMIIGLYPVFFSRNLVRPLNTLLEGVGEVNTGNLTVSIPVLVQDEIGYLSESFNKMVRSILEGKQQLQLYAETLEEKVKERTLELSNSLQQVQQLKGQQDGDYFLTSLILRPLMTNWNKSQLVQTEMFLEQKKHFSFRERHSELGGDICVTGNLRFGDPERPDRYIMFCNADAMGKSMQGAGGAIVMGTALNNIMARSASSDRVLAVHPRSWLEETYRELNSVFRTFDGSMTCSCVLGLVHEQSGQMYYFNAEHPWTVVYRAGRAEFLEEELMLRKLGSPSEFPFQVIERQLSEGDIVLVGSDGRDDVEISGGKAGGERVINEDHELFRRIVEQSAGELEAIVRRVKEAGEITDDFSLIRIAFHENAGRLSTERDMLEARKLLDAGEYEPARDLLLQSMRRPESDMSPAEMLAGAAYQRKDYATATEALEQCLEFAPDSADFWYQLSMALKQMRQFERARDAGERVLGLQPLRIGNLVTLADCYRLLGQSARARELLQQALQQDPQHRAARRVLELLGAST
ncbi:MAG: SpoIIE family protein phosphatase [Leptospirales bacterium]|nr:SpoIIE family protein phosphatase [Leptospirales bacterium]